MLLVRPSVSPLQVTHGTSFLLGVVNFGEHWKMVFVYTKLISACRVTTPCEEDMMH